MHGSPSTQTLFSVAHVVKDLSYRMYKIDCNTRIINADSTWDTKNRKVDLCYLAAIWAPHCDEEALRMMLDWNHWVRLAFHFA